ncbi:Regulator of sigma-E protease RseP [Pirellulimonas nuda]|uniref:Regulator of sigma-E protease RseP n=1 Tax=Pirellulimonas nuda TaxID=2528009 RepID=A0A518D5F3_9BACT|nr:site-2 protease family protein [Pirellulimonas nuda]QDU86700.1 Regulator of sigma-E protease RseP [Pirellulimonas nuda]
MFLIPFASTLFPLADAGLYGYLQGAGLIAMAALGLGFVIFVHELGHFAVAKWCGVKCEKFFVGFDIGGYKLSRKWGETEYGIGILPLGGYVKMLGQDDNPANIDEQLARSKGLEGSSTAKEITGPKGEKLWVDRRSYMAKSVPQRMAIISAGVIMNIIFGFIFAFIAYSMGAPKQTCVAGATVPGSPAWQANLRTGDRIVRINDIVDPTFDDLTGSVVLGNLTDGVTFSILRRDASQPETVVIKPEQKEGELARIGMVSQAMLRLSKEDPARPHSPAAEASPELKGDDEIVAVDGEPVDRFYQFAALLEAKRDAPIKLTLRRGGESPADHPFAPRTGGEEIEVSIAPNPAERFGVVTKLGPVLAVQPGSPAEQAGLKPGDTLLAVDGPLKDNEAIDPLTLNQTLAAAARDGSSVTFSVGRGEGAPLSIDVTPRVADWDEALEPVGLPTLGLALESTLEVAATLPDSPAERAGIIPGDVLVAAAIKSEDEKQPLAGKDLNFKSDKLGWATLVDLMQDHAEDLRLELTVKRGDAEETVELLTYQPAGQFAADRGLVLLPDRTLRYGGSVADRAKMAFDEIGKGMTSVYRFLGKIGGQVPVTGVAGPISIARIAYSQAGDGLATLLLFLTMLSANLAVINFLPIPVLDGGHMVFLAYEGIRGRPAGEKFVTAMHMVGLAFLLSLMVLVFGLDIGRLFGAV